MTKSQSLERGLMVMELLNRADKPMGPREIARALDLSPAIVQRLLNTLHDKHYLRRDAASKRYTIGYQVLGIGAKLQSTDSMLLEARKGLESLNKNMGLDAYLAVLQGQQAIYLLSLQGSGPISLSAAPGQTIQLHNTAIGKAILASFNDDEARELLGSGPLDHTTPKTIIDPNEIISQLSSVRKNGYAVVIDETVVGISSVGAFIGDPLTGTRSAISVAFSPHFAPDLQIQTLAIAVKQVADSVTRKLTG